MLYPNLQEIIDIIIDEGVKIVFTSAGNPKTYTAHLKENGVTVVHVVSSVKFALKAQEEESSAHPAFKEVVVNAKEGDTELTLKELAPVRLIKNKFYQDVKELYKKSPTVDDLKALLGRARAKKGMFEGDLEEGELEIGQIAGLIHDIKPAATILHDMLKEYELAKKEVSNLF